MPRTYQSIYIGAPIDDVWMIVRDFLDFSWSEQVITSCESIGKKTGMEIGAKRLLNRAFLETLIEHSDEHRLMRYSIDDGPSPVSSAEVADYVGRLELRPVTRSNGTFVEWSSSWSSSSEDAVEFCGKIYNALLDELAAKFRT